MYTEKIEKKGIAAVEFALILPMLLLVLFMIIEFSIILYDKAVITNASREGARMGIVDARRPGRTAGAITATVNTLLRKQLDLIWPGNTRHHGPGRLVSTSGNLLTVNVTYTYNFFVLPNFISLSSDWAHPDRKYRYEMRMISVRGQSFLTTINGCFDTAISANDINCRQESAVL